MMQKDTFRVFTIKYLYYRQKNAPKRSVHYSVKSEGLLGFEFAACIFTLGLGAFHPAVTSTRVLTGAARGCCCTGASALAGIDIEASTRFASGYCTDWSHGEHGCSRSSQSNTGNFLCCIHLFYPQFEKIGLLYWYYFLP